MFKVLSVLILTMAVPAWAVQIPAFTGKLTNHSKIPSEKFTVSIDLRCENMSTGGPRTSCGKDQYTVEVKADGTFYVREMNVPYGYYNRVFFRVGINYEDRADLAEHYRNFSAIDGDIRQALPKLQKFTVFESQAAQIIYDVKSPREEFLIGKGRDLYNNFKVYFPDSEHFDDELAEQIRLTVDNAADEKPGYLPHTLLIVAGDLPANSPLKVTASVGASIFQSPLWNITKPFAPEWDEAQRTFALDEDKLPYFARDIKMKSQFMVVQFKMPKAPFENNIVDADLVSECIDGRVHGKIKVKARGGSDYQFEAESDLSGTCEADTARIEFTMPYWSSRDADQLTLHVDRIARGNWLARAPYEGWALDEKSGALTIKLPIYNSAGEIVGNTNGPK